LPESDENATKRPSPEIADAQQRPFPSWPAPVELSHSVVPLVRSRT
jgi:hypothetical protein